MLRFFTYVSLVVLILAGALVVGGSIYEYPDITSAGNVAGICALIGLGCIMFAAALDGGFD